LLDYLVTRYWRPLNGQPDASPHTNYLLLFKERPGGKAPG